MNLRVLLSIFRSFVIELNDFRFVLFSCLEYMDSLEYLIHESMQRSLPVAGKWPEVSRKLLSRAHAQSFHYYEVPRSSPLSAILNITMTQTISELL